MQSNFTIEVKKTFKVSNIKDALDLLMDTKTYASAKKKLKSIQLQFLKDTNISSLCLSFFFNSSSFLFICLIFEIALIAAFPVFPIETPKLGCFSLKDISTSRKLNIEFLVLLKKW